MILPTDSLDTFCSFGSLNVDKVTGTTWKMYNFRIRHGVLGWSHKRRWKDTVTLGMRILLPQHLPSWALPMRHGVLWMEKRKLGAHRPPSQLQGWFVTAHRCTACAEGLSTYVLTHPRHRANHGQWHGSCTVGAPAPCHSKVVRSTYNFLPLFQGQKDEVRQSLFTKYYAFLWGTKGLLWNPPMSSSQEAWVWGWPSPRTSWQWLPANS